VPALGEQQLTGLSPLILFTLAALTLVDDSVPGNDWWLVPIIRNHQGVTALYVERSTITRTPEPRDAWIFEMFDPMVTQTATKKEKVQVDCQESRYLGLEWHWVDVHGEETLYLEPDTRWTSIDVGTPMAAAASFICSQQ
jgi:hypothetical protein